MAVADFMQVNRCGSTGLLGCEKGDWINSNLGLGQGTCARRDKKLFAVVLQPEQKLVHTEGFLYLSQQIWLSLLKTLLRTREVSFL